MEYDYVMQFVSVDIIAINEHINNELDTRLQEEIAAALSHAQLEWEGDSVRYPDDTTLSVIIAAVVALSWCHKTALGTEIAAIHALLAQYASERA